MTLLRKYLVTVGRENSPLTGRNLQLNWHRGGASVITDERETGQMMLFDSFHTLKMGHTVCLCGLVFRHIC